MNSITNNNQINYIFFGSSNLSVIVLNELKQSNYLPSIIVTTPDKEQGRKLVMKPNVVKQWAIDNNIAFYDAGKLNAEVVERLKSDATKMNAQLFIVASYGKIIPKAVLDIPTKGSLNIHPSLLPKYRGPSPLPSVILADDKHTGVTIMKIDEQMDHGPIVAQKLIDIDEWPTYEDFEEMMAISGAQLLIETIPRWIAGDLKETPQDHTAATFTKKIVKEDALIALDDVNADQYLNFRKVQAYHEWPQAYFMVNKRDKLIRVKITSATYSNDKLTVTKVIPEGGREMLYEDFVRGLK